MVQEVGEGTEQAAVLLVWQRTLTQAQQLMFSSELSLVTQKENQTWLQEGRGISVLFCPRWWWVTGV